MRSSQERWDSLGRGVKVRWQIEQGFSALSRQCGEVFAGDPIGQNSSSGQASDRAFAALSLPRPVMSLVTQAARMRFRGEGPLPAGK